MCAFLLIVNFRGLNFRGLHIIRKKQQNIRPSKICTSTVPQKFLQVQYIYSHGVLCICMVVLL